LSAVWELENLAAVRYTEMKMMMQMKMEMKMKMRFQLLPRAQRLIRGIPSWLVCSVGSRSRRNSGRGCSRRLKGDLVRVGYSVMGREREGNMAGPRDTPKGRGEGVVEGQILGTTPPDQTSSMVTGTAEDCLRLPWQWKRLKARG